jgi:hypothetical protein
MSFWTVRVLAWPRCIWFAAAAILAYLINSECFSGPGVGWFLVPVVFGAVAYASIRYRRLAWLANVCFILAIIWNVGWTTYQVHVFGTCVLCPRGSTRTRSGDYWGDWISCRRADGMPLGPAMGTTVTEGGTSTTYYEEYRLVGKSLVGLRLGCCYPFPCIEVCFPDSTGQRCKSAEFEPPLEWKGCSNLSARVSDAFARKCRTRTSSHEPCY